MFFLIKSLYNVTMTYNMNLFKKHFLLILVLFINFWYNSKIR